MVMEMSPWAKTMPTANLPLSKARTDQLSSARQTQEPKLIGHPSHPIKGNPPCAPCYALFACFHLT